MIIPPLPMHIIYGDIYTAHVKRKEKKAFLGETYISKSRSKFKSRHMTRVFPKPNFDEFKRDLNIATFNQQINSL